MSHLLRHIILLSVDEQGDILASIVLYDLPVPSFNQLCDDCPVFCQVLFVLTIEAGPPSWPTAVLTG